MWEDKRLRDVTEADIQQLVNSGLEEHLQLEYKSALYDGNDQGSRESLQDICMFANAGGGILLIGVTELRDGNNQPTGIPDPTAPLGVDLPNPEMLLLSYDARVVANIQERLPLEMFAIPVANNRYVVAIRVPNSTSRPHRVLYQGRVNFPSRRERHKYEMDVREIKEMVMRTASRLEEAQQKLAKEIEGLSGWLDTPSIMIGAIPVFWQNFMVDVRSPQVRLAVSRFHLGNENISPPKYDFKGLQRQIREGEDSAVQVHRDGMITLKNRLHKVDDGTDLYLRPTEIDIVLRACVQRCSEVYVAAGIAGPFLLTMQLRIVENMQGLYPSGTIPGGEDPSGRIRTGDYQFPVVQADNFLDVDRVIRPLCDQAHQMFDRPSSPYFDANGVWRR
jgi:Schlafen, AlbA_2